MLINPQTHNISHVNLSEPPKPCYQCVETGPAVGMGRGAAGEGTFHSVSPLPTYDFQAILLWRKLPGAAAAAVSLQPRQVPQHTQHDPVCSEGRRSPDPPLRGETRPKQRGEHGTSQLSVPRKWLPHMKCPLQDSPVTPVWGQKC